MASIQDQTVAQQLDDSQTIAIEVGEYEYVSIIAFALSITH